MPTSPFLGIQQLTASQSQKEVTINDAILQLESASCGTLAVAFPTLTVTLSVMQFTHYFMFTAGTATADAVLQVPHAVNGNPTQRLFGVRNTTGYGLTVRSDTTGGAVVVIPNGEARLLAIADNDVFIAAEPGVAVAFLGLTDVPHAYTGKGGQALVATMAEDGLEFIALVKSLGDLTDVDLTTTAPSAGKVLTYVSGRWQPADLPSASTTFLALTDTPSSYTGAANKFLRVNGAATAVEFIDITQVPTDGTSGQVLTKGSGSAYGWADPTRGTGVPAGGTTGQVLTKLSDTDGDADWENPTGGAGSGSPWSIIFKPRENEPPVTNYAAIDLRNNHPVLKFDATTQVAAVFSGVLSNDYAGNGLRVELYVAVDTAVTGTLGFDVAFERIDAGTLDIDADSFGAATTVTAVTVPATSGITLKMSVDVTDGTDIDNLAPGDMFRLRIRRDVANDTTTGDGQLLAVSIREVP